MTSVRRRARGVAASRAVMMHSSPLRDDRFIVMDVSTARAIADALRTAGTRAGATGDVAARGDASSAATLAATCHEKMRFDFPSVRAREVRALARAMRDRLREDDVGEATREFPVTTALARNCAEEASREMARASELGGAGGDADADDDARDRGGGASAEGELAIEFVVARRGRAVVKRQTLAELLDFQANGGLLPLPRG